VTADQVIPSAQLSTLNYVPVTNANGLVGFTVTASDGSLSSSTASVNMNITPVNDAPAVTGPIGPATVETFATVGSNTWTVPAGVTSIEVLVVGGGGSGGGSTAGGGGGGGLVYQTAYAVTSGTAYTVTVGAGGAQVSNQVVGNSGGNSVFGPLTAIGGGGGGATSASTAFVGKNGGSGGGGAYYGGRTAAPGTGTAGQGNNGGLSGSDGNYPGGGGGGAGAAGAAPTSSKSGNGGAGLSYDISGSTVSYAGGGGGGSNYAGGNGGTGGGGAGTSDGNAGTAGTANTGGGGGGGWLYASGTGGAGGSGVVIVRYKSAFGSAATFTSSPTSYIDIPNPLTGDFHLLPPEDHRHIGIGGSVVFWKRLGGRRNRRSGE
jgi:hypothetical protein